MSKVKIDFYEVRLIYHGNLEDNDEFDLLTNARLYCMATHQGYVCSEYVSYGEADVLDGDFSIEDIDPENHTCTVCWSERDEDYDGRTEEEKDYDSECEWSNYRQSLSDAAEF